MEILSQQTSVTTRGSFNLDRIAEDIGLLNTLDLHPMTGMVFSCLLLKSFLEGNATNCLFTLNHCEPVLFITFKLLMKYVWHWMWYYESVILIRFNVLFANLEFQCSSELLLKLNVLGLFTVYWSYLLRANLTKNECAFH